MKRLQKFIRKWIIAAPLVVLLCIAGFSVRADTSPKYSLSFIDTGCCNKKVAATTLVSGDVSQDPNDQDEAWENFKETNEGLVDDDRTGNRTYAYNCHGYAFEDTESLNVAAFSPYLGNASGCWAPNPCGAVRADPGPPSHSCLTSDNEGKCGANFRCKNNQHVYADVDIWTVYGKIY
jgi:hypothetical protein